MAYTFYIHGAPGWSFLYIFAYILYNNLIENKSQYKGIKYFRTDLFSSSFFLRLEVVC